MYSFKTLGWHSQDWGCPLHLSRHAGQVHALQHHCAGDVLHYLLEDDSVHTGHHAAKYAIWPSLRKYHEEALERDLRPQGWGKRSCWRGLLQHQNSESICNGGQRVQPVRSQERLNLCQSQASSSLLRTLQLPDADCHVRLTWCSSLLRSLLELQRRPDHRWVHILPVLHVLLFVKLHANGFRNWRSNGSPRNQHCHRRNLYPLIKDQYNWWSKGFRVIDRKR